MAGTASSEVISLPHVEAVCVVLACSVVLGTLVSTGSVGYDVVIVDCSIESPEL